MHAVMFEELLVVVTMLLVGLTGGIGTGKSVVSKIFRQHGIVVVDADEVAKYVVEPGRPAYQMLRKEFGDEYFDDEKDSGRLQRQKLGQLVFNDAEKRRRLNAIVHPAVRRELLWRVLRAAFSLEKIVVLDVPLFFESGYDRWIRHSIVVSCDTEKQVERVKTRDNLSEADVRARIAAQMPTAEKVKRAMYIIDNDGSLESTQRQVEAVIRELRASWQPFFVRTFVLAPLAVLAVGWILF